jgi:hypothetical protein
MKEPAPRMYFAILDASPKCGTDAFDRYGGAHIACWINTVDFKEARVKAMALAEHSGWFVRAVKEEKLISAADYDPANEGLDRFNQALIDGEVSVIYTFPQGQNNS